MVRHQVVGVLGSFLSNRQNEFRDMVHGSSLEPAVKHQLHFINRWRAWYALSVPLTMHDGIVIPDDIRRLARSIFRAVTRQPRRPALHRLNMVVDQRMVAVSPSHKASYFRMWARLQTYPNFTTRAGEILPFRRFSSISAAPAAKGI